MDGLIFHPPHVRCTTPLSFFLIALDPPYVSIIFSCSVELELRFVTDKFRLYSLFLYVSGILFYIEFAFCRELFEIWCRVATVHPGGSENGTVVSETCRLQSLFHQANVYPSQSQILEMIHCAREREQQQPQQQREQRESAPPATDSMTPASIDSSPHRHRRCRLDQQTQQQEQRNFLTFGEFCLFANELRKCYERE